ncbi:MAG: hydrogenase maturation peptidase HycI [Euryarchaeota archaeon]|nr:hydrogenase maturation peptidase HycI [Euryarchaeota archaeon]
MVRTTMKNQIQYLILCVGNRDGGDDAIGPYIADCFRDRPSPGVEVIDTGVTPENFTSLVKKKKPKNLIIIDAVEMGLKPGETRVVPKEKIGTMHVSTHGIPLSVLMTYLESYTERIILIGVEPKILSGRITKIVKKSGDQLVKLIEDERLEEIKRLQ